MTSLSDDSVVRLSGRRHGRSFSTDMSAACTVVCVNRTMPHAILGC